MKPILIILILLIITQNIISQEYQATQTLDIHTNPWTIVDYTPRIRLGIEYNAASKLSYACEFGFGNDLLNNWRNGNINATNYLFYEVRPEVIYNFFEINHISIYSSIEGFFMNMEQTRHNSSYTSNSNSGYEIQFESAELNKIKYGSHLKIGLHSAPLERINFDFYFGMGMARRIFSYSNLVNPVYTNQLIFIEWLPQAFRSEGSRNIFHLTAGFKIGVLLWKKYEE